MDTVLYGWLLLVAICPLSLGYPALETNMYEDGYSRENLEAWRKILRRPCWQMDNHEMDLMLGYNDRPDVHHKPSFHYRKIIMALNKTSNEFVSLINHYTENRFGTPLMIDEFAHFKLAGLPQPAPRTLHTHIQTDWIVDTSYHNLARALVYIQRVYEDEARYEYDDVTMNTIRHILHKRFPRLLCHMNILMTQSLRLEVRQDIVNDITETDVKNINERALRHIRDFIILRDVLTLLKSQKIDYTVLNTKERENEKHRKEHEENKDPFQ